jgi:hypothetical protein
MHVKRLHLHVQTVHQTVKSHLFRHFCLLQPHASPTTTLLCSIHLQIQDQPAKPSPTKKMDNDARRTDNRQWESNSPKIRDGHLMISVGFAPEPLKMKETRGPKGAQIKAIHQLQQELIDAALQRGAKGIAHLKKEVEGRKVSDDLDRLQYEVYQSKLRKLRDDLRLAALAEADEQTVETLGGMFQFLEGALGKASAEVKRKTVRSLADRFGVALAGHVDVETMFERPEKKKRRKSPLSADNELPTSGDESPKNDVASDAHQDVDGVHREGVANNEDESPKDAVIPDAHQDVGSVNGGERASDENPRQEVNDAEGEGEGAENKNAVSPEKIKEQSPEDVKPGITNDNSNNVPNNVPNNTTAAPVSPHEDVLTPSESPANQINSRPATPTTTTTITTTTTTTTTTVTTSVA